MELLDTELTRKEREHLQAHLADDEEVLWVARPVVSYLRGGILPIGLFGLGWCTMLTMMLTQNGAGWEAAPFILVGIALLSAPVLIYRHQKQSAYVLSNKCAYILRPTLTGRVCSTAYPAGSNMVQHTEAKLDGTGSLIFGYQTVHTKHGTRQQPYGFLHTRKLAEAERTIASLPPLSAEQLQQKNTNELSPTTARIIGCISALIGIIVLCLGAHRGIQSYQLSQTGLRADASVCKLLRERDSEGDLIYYPVFRFCTPDGLQHEVKSNAGSNPPAWKRGETLRVIYPEGKPQEAVSDTFGGLWIAAVFLSVFGCIGCTIGAAFIFTFGRKTLKTR